MSFDKAEQLIDLARRAAGSRQGVTLDEIVQNYGVSLRTAQRMCRALEANFAQTESFLDQEGWKRWRLPGGQYREFFSLNAEEISAIELGASHLHRAGLEIEATALSTLRDKVLALIPAKQILRIE